MDPGTTLAVIVGMITLGVTISSVVGSINPRRPHTKFDVIDDELSRLHDELGEYSSAPGWISHEIGRLNSELIRSKDEPQA